MSELKLNKDTWLVQWQLEDRVTTVWLGGVVAIRAANGQVHVYSCTKDIFLAPADLHDQLIEAWDLFLRDGG